MLNFFCLKIFSCHKQRVGCFFAFPQNVENFHGKQLLWVKKKKNQSNQKKHSFYCSVEKSGWKILTNLTLRLFMVLCCERIRQELYWTAPPISVYTSLWQSLHCPQTCKPFCYDIYSIYLLVLKCFACFYFNFTNRVSCWSAWFPPGCLPLLWQIALKGCSSCVAVGL